MPIIECNRIGVGERRRLAALSSAARTFGATPAAAEDKYHHASAVGEQQLVPEQLVSLIYRKNRFVSHLRTGSS